MAHHIYTTEGFVLDRLPFGEGNSFIYLFTRDLGLVGASARSVRDIKSKLRYGLQNFCHSKISLVRGRYEWKVTSALPNKNLYHLFLNDHQKFMVCAHAFLLIKKLVTGEERNEKLFDIVSEGIKFLEENNLDSKQISNLECIMMLRIVSNLGYLTSDKDLEYFVENNEWNADLLSLIEKHKTKAVKEINLSIKESQL